MIFYDETEFDKSHEERCGNNCFNVVSGQNEPETVECPCCGAWFIPVQYWFNSDANPQYDEDGRKTGSGEWQRAEFVGEIPE